MKTFIHVIVIVLFLFTVVNCSSRHIKLDAGGILDFNQTIKCAYQYGQFFGEKSGVEQHDFERQNVMNSNILRWDFMDISSDTPSYSSGGDTGAVLVFPHSVTKDGISIVLTQGNGTHLFAIWSDGTSFWTKHNNLLGSRASEQYVGTCTN